jgi:Mg-chelatase subunit ChlI
MTETVYQALRKSTRLDTDPLTDIYGQGDAKKQILASILAGHHVIIVGPPGIGKTTLAKQVASLLPPVKAVKGCQFFCDPENPICPTCKSHQGAVEAEEIPGDRRFRRIQGSPDLSVEDLLGDIDPSLAFKYGPTDYRVFTPGKLLKGNRGVVFFDELNRVPEKLQNSLLQILEEHIATIGSYDIDYPAEFIMIATMNPKEHAGTEELSDVLLDRFDMVRMTYPESPEIEKRIILEKSRKYGDSEVPDTIVDAIVKLVQATRIGKWADEFEQPASPRASIGLYEKVQTLTLFDGGRREASIDDLLECAGSVLMSRIRISPQSQYYEDPEELLEKVIKDVTK